MFYGKWTAGGCAYSLYVGGDSGRVIPKGSTATESIQSGKSTINIHCQWQSNRSSVFCYGLQTTCMQRQLQPKYSWTNLLWTLIKRREGPRGECDVLKISLVISWMCCTLIQSLAHVGGWCRCILWGHTRVALLVVVWVCVFRIIRSILLICIP